MHSCLYVYPGSPLLFFLEDPSGSIANLSGEHQPTTTPPPSQRPLSTLSSLANPLSCTTLCISLLADTDSLVRGIPACHQADVVSICVSSLIPNTTKDEEENKKFNSFKDLHLCSLSSGVSSL
jgi:hypothetical protein